jgi:hypothetical protein
MHTTSRSQVVLRNARVGATPLLCSHKKLRHPERSEANDSLFPGAPARAQSKDLADLPCDSRSETELLHAGLTRRHGIEMPFSSADRPARTTRSFDSGSVKFSGKTPALFAFAQYDGGLERARAGGIGSEAARKILQSVGPFPSTTWERGKSPLVPTHLVIP